MIAKDNKIVSINKQCQLLSVNRSRYYYQPIFMNQSNFLLMRLIDQQHLKTPFYGARKMAHFLKRQGHEVGRKKTRRLMHLMNIHVIYQKPRTSIPNLKHKIYPYLLRDLEVTRPNQVWCTDITYIPMEQGFMYLVAVMDWFSRKVLSWKISNSMDVDFCSEALKRAIDKYGKPEIFNTDQGSQFTSAEFTEILQNAGIAISMDGKGRWIDNVFIERLWRSCKYECVYLQEFSGGHELKIAVDNWMNFYNSQRPHQRFFVANNATHCFADGQTPDEIYTQNPPELNNDFCSIQDQKLAA